MRGPKDAGNGPLYEYTQMPSHMNRRFSPEEFGGMELAGPLPFTKGCQVMKIPGRTYVNPYQFGDMLFDLSADPGQDRVLDDPEAEARMIRLMAKLMRENGAPPEQFERLGIPADGRITPEEAALQKETRRSGTP